MSHTSALELAKAAAAKGDVDGVDRLLSGVARQSATDERMFLLWCDLHAARGHAEAAERAIREGIARFPSSRDLLLRYASLQREFDKRDESALILEHLLKSATHDAETVELAAAVDFERGRNALSLYRRAIAASPAKPQIVLGYAAALHAAGRLDEAIDLLTSRVTLAPNWTDGLNALARLRWERGDGLAYTAAHEQALKTNPANLHLWGAYLGILSSSLQFGTVLERLPEARTAAGEHVLFDMFEAQALSETGQHKPAEVIFKSLEPVRDPGFAPMRMRSLLRTGRAAEAAALGEQFVSTPSASFIWPLLALAWRASENSRWQWLERFDETTAVVDLPITSTRLSAIAEHVRGLHRNSGQPYDQSVRGGSQTLGNLLQRTDPEIVELREAIRAAIRQFIDSLPPQEAGHPFLGRDRGPFRFCGSWSIRLADAGFHVAHVHPAGWISSALYLELPEFEAAEDTSGAALERPGWLALGGAPPEFELGLEPVAWVEPRPGRLALFPSIMWHETMPYRAGERLTVAFDVVPFV